MPSVSKSQQRLFGIAYSIKKGNLSLQDLPISLQDKIKQLLKMDIEELKKFASTDTENLPIKKESYVNNFYDFCNG